VVSKEESLPREPRAITSGFPDAPNDACDKALVQDGEKRSSSPKHRFIEPRAALRELCFAFLTRIELMRGMGWLQSKAFSVGFQVPFVWLG